MDHNAITYISAHDARFYVSECDEITQIGVDGTVEEAEELVNAVLIVLDEKKKDPRINLRSRPSEEFRRLGKDIE